MLGRQLSAEGGIYYNVPELQYSSPNAIPYKPGELAFHQTLPVQSFNPQEAGLNKYI